MALDESMSQEMIYQILFSALSTVDSILQIWLTVTFAVLLAAYLAGRHVNQFMYVLISTLYALASFVLMTRFVSAVLLMFNFQNQLVVNGYMPWPVPSVIGAIIGGGTFLLLFGGTIGTLWYMRSTRKEVEVGGS